MSDYFERYENISMKRDAAGVLEVRFHTQGADFQFNQRSRDELVDAFLEIGRDRRNRVVILTGSGESWMATIDLAGFGNLSDPEVWDETLSQGRRLVENLLNIEVPVIAAVNGAALLHTECILTCDIILAAPEARFQDVPHLDGGVPPCDGMHVLWPHVLGPIRGKYFLLTQQSLSAEEARDLGVVNEVVPRDALLERAHAIAAFLGKQPTLTLRYTRAGLTQRIKRLVAEGLPYGLALEGLANAAQRGVTHH